MRSQNDGMLAALELLERHETFVIVSHLDPDGDSLGSSLALSLALEQLSKKATVIIRQQVPPGYLWLPECDRVLTLESLPPEAPVAILVECSDFERSGITGFDGRLTLNIDHHAKNSLFADVNWVDSSAAATGMMIFRLLQALNLEVTRDIATLLYVALLTDTGSFQHSNTNAMALETAAALVTHGAEPEKVASAVYGRQPIGKIRLLASALSSLELEDEGCIASMSLPVEFLSAEGGNRETEGIIQHAQAIEGVRVTLFLKEVGPGRHRISLRSDGSVDVGDLAHRFGGGGHARAAGCELEGELTTVRSTLLEAVRASLADADEAEIQ